MLALLRTIHIHYIPKEEIEALQQKQDDQWEGVSLYPRLTKGIVIFQSVGTNERWLILLILQNSL